MFSTFQFSPPIDFVLFSSAVKRLWKRFLRCCPRFSSFIHCSQELELTQTKMGSLWRFLKWITGEWVPISWTHNKKPNGGRRFHLKRLNMWSWGKVGGEQDEYQVVSGWPNNLLHGLPLNHCGDYDQEAGGRVASSQHVWEDVKTRIRSARLKSGLVRMSYLISLNPLHCQYIIWVMWHDPGMIYKTVEVIWNFVAEGRESKVL